MAKKYVYLFKEGDASMRELLGGKGANLAEMTKIGLPVPQGFTISTEACTQYYALLKFRYPQAVEIAVLINCQRFFIFSEKELCIGFFASI